jgi:hypothetical protein
MGDRDFIVDVKKIIFASVKLSLLLIVVWFVGDSLHESIRDVNWAKIRFQPAVFLLGVFIVFSSVLFIGTKGVQYIYRHLDDIRLSSIQSFILLSLPQLGKYLPSKFFALAGHTAVAKTFGIGIVVSGSVTFLLMGFGLASATLIGMVLLLFHVSTEFLKLLLPGCGVGIAILSVLILFPDLYWQMVNTVLALFERPKIVVTTSPKIMAELFILLLLQNGLYMLGVSLIVLGAIDLSVSMLPMLVGSVCLANVIGFLAIFAPAGIGVREGILLLMLTPSVGPGIAGLIAVLMRAIQTIVDCILGFSGFTVYQLLRKENKGNI